MATRKLTTAFALLTVLALIAPSAAQAGKPKALYLAPGHSTQPLPKFGFRSYNIHGVGDRVTYVRWNGLAAQLGLEPGDTILAVNHFPLTYDGAWRDALRDAMYSGGWVQLAIRDVRTGHVVYRQTFVGSYGHGPITQKMYAPHHEHHGPITMKSQHGSKKKNQPKIKIDLGKQLEKLAEMIDD